MTASLSTVNSILKEFYATQIAEQLNQQTLLLSAFKKATLQWAGKYVVVPVHIARNSGVGAVAEGGTLPTPGQQGYANYQVFCKYVYGQLNITGPTIALGTNAIGVASALTSEVDELVKDVSKTMNRMLYYGGRVIGFVWQKHNSATFQYAGNPNDSIVPGNSVPTGVGETAQLVRLDTYATVGVATQLNSVTVGSTSATSAVVFNAAIDTTGVPDAVAMAVVHQDPVMTSRVTGIVGNLADPNQFGVDRSNATNARLRSNFRLNDPTAPAFSALDDNQLQGLLDDVSEQTGSYPDVIYCAPKMRRQYTESLAGVSNANFLASAVGEKQGDAGLAAGGTINFNGLPMVVDPDAPLGCFIAVTSDSWKWAEAKKGEFVPGTSGYLIQQPTTDAYLARYCLYGEAYSSRPNANGILTGVAY